MTTRQTHTPSIAAAKWPMILIASVVLVAIVAATPFVIHRLVSEVAPARTATWVTVIAGLVLALVLATAWVFLRRRRQGD